MEIKTIITSCVVYVIAIATVVSTLPTFGNEYVHIKVHIPSEPSSTKGFLKPTTPIVHHKPSLTRHKVIHHYHRRRKPDQKIPRLENFYLAELDRHPVPHSAHDEHDTQLKKETYVVKEHHNHQHYLEKPLAKINTYKIIEEYNHVQHLPHQHHYLTQEHEETHIENVESVEPSVESLETPDNIYHPHHNHHAKQKQQLETVKIVNEEPHYHYHEANSHKNDEEISQLIQPSLKYISPASQSNHHDLHYQKPIQEEHIFHKPQTAAADIFKAIATIPKDYYENVKPEDHSVIPEIIEETLDVFANKKAKNHNYHITPTTNYHYKPEQQEISIEEQAEYEKPKSVHHQPYSLQSHKQTKSLYVTPVPIAPNHAVPNHYGKYLPASEVSIDFKQSQENIQHAELKAKDDLAYAVENPNGPETYTGYDSYSAGHVQGLNSGGYNQHSQ